LHLDLTAKEIPVPHQPQGRGFVVEHLDCLAALGHWRHSGLTLRQWFASLRCVRECAWFASDDPLPFVMLCLRFALRGARRTVRQREQRNAARIHVPVAFAMALSRLLRSEGRSRPRGRRRGSTPKDGR
jgi:hypothetical protein